MTSKRTFYRNVITVEVLSEAPLSGKIRLSDIEYMMSVDRNMVYADGAIRPAQPLARFPTNFYTESTSVDSAQVRSAQTGEECFMLIVNENQLLQAGVGSLGEPCPSCCKPLSCYPLILSEEAQQKVYHAACAVQLATEILVDVFTFFHPPAPWACLFTLTETSPSERKAGSDAIDGS